MVARKVSPPSRCGVAASARRRLLAGLPPAPVAPAVSVRPRSPVARAAFLHSYPRSSLFCVIVFFLHSRALTRSLSSGVRLRPHHTQHYPAFRRFGEVAPFWAASSRASRFSIASIWSWVARRALSTNGLRSVGVPRNCTGPLPNRLLRSMPCVWRNDKYLTGISTLVVLFSCRLMSFCCIDTALANSA